MEPNEIRAFFTKLKTWLVKNDASFDFAVEAIDNFVWFKVDDMIITGLSPEKARELGQILISESNKIQKVH